MRQNSLFFFSFSLFIFLQSRRQPWRRTSPSSISFSRAHRFAFPCFSRSLTLPAIIVSLNLNGTELKSFSGSLIARNFSHLLRDAQPLFSPQISSRQDYQLRARGPPSPVDHPAPRRHHQTAEQLYLMYTRSMYEPNAGIIGTRGFLSERRVSIDESEVSDDRSAESAALDRSANNGENSATPPWIHIRIN